MPTTSNSWRPASRTTIGANNQHIQVADSWDEPEVHENWSSVFAGVSDFRAELHASCRDRDMEWGEVYWNGHHSDGAVFAMCGVIIATIRDDRIASARLYVEPVEQRDEDIGAAVEHLYRLGPSLEAVGYFASRAP